MSVTDDIFRSLFGIINHKEYYSATMQSFFRKNTYLCDNRPADIVNEVVRNIAPYLKIEGYNKRGRNWVKQETGYSSIINVQANKWNRQGNEVRFAVNYGIYVPSTYEASFLLPLPKNPTEANLIISKRLTHTSYADHWWKIHSQKDMEQASKQVREWIEVVALPYFARIHTLTDIAKILSETQNPGNLRFAAIMWAELGDKKRARDLFQETLSKAAQNNPIFAENVKAQALRYKIIL